MKYESFSNLLYVVIIFKCRTRGMMITSSPGPLDYVFKKKKKSSLLKDKEEPYVIQKKREETVIQM